MLSIVFRPSWPMILVSGGIFVANAWKYFLTLTQHAGLPAPRGGTDEMAASVGALDPEDDIVQLEAAAG